MAMGTSLLILLVIVGLVAAAVIFVGLPAEWKEMIQRKIVEYEARRRGESAATAFMKDKVDKIPEADRDKAEQISKGLGGLTGGDLNNPLGNLGKKDE